MSKKIIIVVAIVAVAIAIWRVVVFFQERELEKHILQSPPASNVNNVNKEEKLSGDYSWGTAAGPNQAQYKNAVWQPITASALAGLPPSAAAVEKSTENCQGLGVAVLRREGCMCQTGYWVEIKQNNEVKTIDTEAKLKNALLPIDSATKAVSLVMLTKGDLHTDHDIPTGHTLATSDGYLVQVVENNTCGCSTHAPTGVIYKVTKSGAVAAVASKIVPPGEGPEICVD